MRRLPITTLPLFVVLLAVAALAPAVASAAECRYAAPRNMHLDLAGVQSIRVEVHSHNLHLRGGAGTGLTLAGRACASDQATLADLTVTQRREGNQLLLDLGNQSRSTFHLFGSSYAYLDVTVQLPTSLPVTLSVGSGDAAVDLPPASAPVTLLRTVLVRWRLARLAPVTSMQLAWVGTCGWAASVRVMCGCVKWAATCTPIPLARATWSSMM